MSVPVVVPGKIFCLIAHECGSYRGHGGIATYMTLTAGGLASTGLSVHVIYLQGCGVDAPGVTSWKVQDTGDIEKNARAVDALLEHIRPDYVECAEFLGLLSYTLKKRAAFGLDYPCTFATNHHTGIREIWEWGTQIDFASCAPDGMKTLYRAERAQALLSDMNYAPSTFLAEYLSDRDGREVGVCPSWYPAPPATTPPPPRDISTLRLISLGRFEGRKQQALLVRAVCELLDEGVPVEMTLIGNSDRDFYSGQDCREYCYGLIPPVWRDAFHFYDFIPHDALLSQYAAYDLFVIPSPYENFPYAALEAINAGIMVVGSLTSGIRDMCGDTLRAYGFEKHSVADMKRVILLFYRLSSEVRETVRGQQRATVWDLTSFARSIEDRVVHHQRLAAISAVISEVRPLTVGLDRRGRVASLLVGSRRLTLAESDWMAHINAATHLVLLTDGHNGEAQGHYYPPPEVAACFTRRVRPGCDTATLARGKQTFSQLTLCLDGKTCHDRETPEMFIGRLLAAVGDVIFFAGEQRHREIAMGDGVKHGFECIAYRCGEAETCL